MHMYSAWSPAYQAVVRIAAGAPLDNARRAVRSGRCSGGEAEAFESCTRATGSVTCQVSGLRAGLEWTGFGEALDRFDLCVVLRDALGCQIRVVEPRAHDDSDALDRSGFHVVDAVRVRATVACQPHDRWRDRLNRHGAPPLCFRRAGSRG